MLTGAAHERKPLHDLISTTSIGAASSYSSLEQAGSTPMGRYVTVAVSLWVVLTFTVGVSALTGISLGAVAAVFHRDTLVRAPTFDLSPMADCQSPNY
jgi:hypothetical protein